MSGLESTVQPEEGSVLDRRTLNRTLLARQCLLDRVEVPPIDAVERLVGMQAQVPLDPYVGLWSRLAAFDPDALGQTLLERRLVRMTLMRSTLHLVSARDAVGIRSVLQGVIERAFATSPFSRNLAGLELDPVIARGIELVEQEPRTIAALRTALSVEWPGYDANSLAYAVRYLVPLVQVTPRGVWGRTRQPAVTTLASWLGELPGARLELEELVVRYLRAFGPASAADIRTWSWLGDARSLVEGMGDRLRAYRNEAGRVLYDVDDGVFCDGGVPAPVRLLPEYDNLFLSHADRGRLMEAIRWDSSFVRQGTVFVDGFLAGAWRLRRERGGATLEVEPRVRLRRAELKALRAEAEQLLAFLTPEARTRALRLSPA